MHRTSIEKKSEILCEAETARRTFQPIQHQMFSLVSAALSTRKTRKNSSKNLFKDIFSCKEKICLCGKTSCCDDSLQTKDNLTMEGLNTGTPKDCDYAAMSIYRKMLRYIVYVTSTNRRIHTIQHAFTICEQKGSSLSCFYPKIKVQQDGIHNVSVNIALDPISFKNTMPDSYKQYMLCYFFYNLIFSAKFLAILSHSIKAQQFPKA